MKRALSSYHPILYTASVTIRRLFRRLRWVTSGPWAKKQEGTFPVRLFRHQSLLLRKLGNVDMRLQKNKITNLTLAASALDGVVVRPGETFSFWRAVGNPTARRGYIPGMLISNGQVLEGIGGGLCQMANLLYWMALHTPLTITERHRHSLDLFPDSGRVLPFGSGATLFYNYMDLAWKNNTNQAFQLRVWLTDTQLMGEILAERLPKEAQHVEEHDHAFTRAANGSVWRHNQLFQVQINRKTGERVRESLIAKNDCRVVYEVDPALITKTKHAP